MQWEHTAAGAGHHIHPAGTAPSPAPPLNWSRAGCQPPKLPRGCSTSSQLHPHPKIRGSPPSSELGPTARRAAAAAGCPTCARICHGLGDALLLLPWIRRDKTRCAGGCRWSCVSAAPRLHSPPGSGLLQDKGGFPWRDMIKAARSPWA